VCIGVFKVVGKYDAINKKYYELPRQSAHWPKNTVPRDVPKCGFNGKKCAKESENPFYNLWKTFSIFYDVVRSIRRKGVTRLHGVRGKKQVWRPSFSNLKSFGVK